ncbi:MULTISPECIES: hypothetical protein [unclassified Sphingomonas]|uniref:hypothetical protein n=1 Tax=unclassified Sphingomonas TaxID=196159 RepID=UPI0006FFE4F0|nr:MULTISPECIES: hypothetical protein [unclassified Sphingomonas]KQM23839.1 hypothetical protein ASE58_16180 [Sphingomonas sp. Leaf9]KQM41966.1 hypothetical protein ASE57_16180 [Sphingomonas sp. Leaf11]
MSTRYSAQRCLHARALSPNAVCHVAPRGPAPIRWWEPLLPARCWLAAAALTLAILRAMMRARRVDRPAFARLLRLSARLSRAGFNAWRFWDGAWR